MGSNGVNEDGSVYDPDWDEVDDARLAELERLKAAGGPFISNEKVMAWLKSVGTPDELPAPMADVYLSDLRGAPKS